MALQANEDNYNDTGSLAKPPSLTKITSLFGKPG